MRGGNVGSSVLIQNKTVTSDNDFAFAFAKPLSCQTAKLPFYGARYYDPQL